MTTMVDSGIPYVAGQQAQPEITHNDALNMLWALANGVLDRGINAPPGGPAQGDAYIVGLAPTGAWAGRPNRIATWFGTAWVFLPGTDSSGTPIAMGVRQEGLTVWVRDEDVPYVWNGAAWALVSGSVPESIVVACSDETTPITVGTAKVTFRMPFAMNLTGARASLTTASSAGLVTVDINEGGATILSTKLTIDQGERTSQTAATPPVISDVALADDAEITIDIDVAGTEATGLKVALIGTRS